MKYRANASEPFRELYIKALDSMPIGSIIGFVGTDIPNGWLICDGSTLDAETYPELYDALGGSGSTFTLPDYQGRTPVGYDSNDTDFNAIGKTGGSKELQAHTHNVAVGWGESDADLSNYYPLMQTSQGYAKYMPNGGSGGNFLKNAGSGNSGNLQPYIVQYFIIKAKNTTPTMASIVNTTNNSTTDGYSCDFINKLHTYSTNEIKTGANWVNGKPIYKKTIDLTSGWNIGSETLLSHNIANVDNMLKYEGTAYRGDGQNQMIPSYFGSNDWILSVFDMSSTSYRLYVGRLFTSSNALTHIYITFYYTKTTD